MSGLSNAEKESAETSSVENEPWTTPEQLPNLLLPVNGFDFDLLPDVLIVKEFSFFRRSELPVTPGPAR